MSEKTPQAKSLNAKGSPSTTPRQSALNAPTNIAELSEKLAASKAERQRLMQQSIARRTFKPPSTLDDPPPWLVALEKKKAEKIAEREAALEGSKWVDRLEKLQKRREKDEQQQHAQASTGSASPVNLDTTTASTATATGNAFSAAWLRQMRDERSACSPVVSPQASPNRTNRMNGTDSTVVHNNNSTVDASS